MRSLCFVWPPPSPPPAMEAHDGPAAFFSLPPADRIPPPSPLPSFSPPQDIYTQTMSQCELTQMADLDDGTGMTPMSPRSPYEPVDLRNVPWGRLIPCAGGGAGAGAGAGAGGGGLEANPTARENGAGGIDLFPRDPLQPAPLPSSSSSSASAAAAVPFLGLAALRPSDRFNEFVLGRSARSDLVARRRPAAAPPPPPGGGPASSSSGADADAAALERRARNSDWAHSMISNRHCRIYCTLKPSGGPARRGRPPAPEMEVCVEDTSGNGTAVNRSVHLGRGERRILHTGDEVCLVRPEALGRRVRSPEERADLVRHYSYIFVNLHEQQRGPHGGPMARAQAQAQLGGWTPTPTPTRTRTPTAAAAAAAAAAASSSGRRGGRASAGAGAGAGSGGRRRGLVDITKCRTSQEDDDRAAMPPPASGTKAGAGAGGAAAGRSRGGTGAAAGGGGIFSSVMRQASGRRARLQQQAETRPSGPPVPGHQQHQHQRQEGPRRVQDHYDIRDLLGSGTCGEVRRCINRRTGEELAVKVIPTAGRGRMPAMRQHMSDAAIRAEAGILQALDHPYIVKLVDVFVAPNQAVYLVMEMLRGGDLFDRIVERQRYGERDARRIMRRILAAVHYLHEVKDIVHRDLKPENILCVGLTDDVNVKLTDFGLAKSLTEDGLKTFCGTPQYFAPEVLRRRHTVAGHGRYGKEADMWSIGVILYILLSGTPPFDVSESIDVVADAKISFGGDRFGNVSARALDLVSRLLVADPAERLSVVDACSHEWIMEDDGDTHRHPLDDPALGQELKQRKSDAAAKNTNDAIMEVVNPKRAQSEVNALELSPAPTKKRLQFSDNTNPGKVATARAQKKMGGGAAPKMAAASARQNKKHPTHRKKQQLLPVLKKPAEKKEKKEGKLTEFGSASAKNGERRPSPRSIVGASLGDTPPSTNATSENSVSGPEGGSTEILNSAQKDAPDDSVAQSGCNDEGQKKAAENPQLELPDDGIVSDFSDEDANDVIEEFEDSHHAPPPYAEGGNNSRLANTASNDGKAAGSSGLFPSSQASSILSEPVDFVMGSVLTVKGTTRQHPVEKPVIIKFGTKATGAKAVPRLIKKAQMTLDGKIIATIPDSELLPKRAGSQCSMGDRSTLSSSSDLALGPPCPQSAMKIQRTLDGKAVTPAIAEPVAEVIRKEEADVVELDQDEEQIVSTSASETISTNSTGSAGIATGTEVSCKGKQMTLVNWFSKAGK